MPKIELIEVKQGREVKRTLPTSTALVEVKPQQISSARRPRRRRNRRSKRSSRRARNGFVDIARQPLGSWNQSQIMAPVSSAQAVPSAFFRQTGAPKHKDYGVGVRYTGVTPMGSLATFSLSSAAFYPNYVDAKDFSNSVTAWTNVMYAIHPYNIARLQLEARNWGRYCIRAIKVHYTPQCPTTTAGGFAYMLTRDSTWMLNQGTVAATYESITVVNPCSIQGPWYPSCLSDSAWSTDRTFSTNYPLFYGTPTNQQGFLFPYLEDSVQFLFGARWNGSNATFAVYGTFTLEYVVDFYQTRTSSVAYMYPITIPSTTSLASESSSSSSTSSDESKEIKGDKDFSVLTRDGSGQLTPHPVSYRQAVGRRPIVEHFSKDEEKLLTIGRVKDPPAAPSATPGVTHSKDRVALARKISDLIIGSDCEIGHKSLPLEPATPATELH